MYLRNFYEEAYRPANHPGDDHRRTVGEYRSQLNNLDRFLQFPWWCERFDNPSHGLPLAELYDKHFHWWLRYCDSPPAELRATWENLSDDLVIGAMNFLVEMGRERTTANKLRLHVNAIWREGHKRGKISVAPLNESYRVNIGSPIALLPDELERVLITATQRAGTIGPFPAGFWWPRALWFVFSLGVRITAAVGVPTANLDLVRGEATVPAWAQKNRREQRLDLFPHVVDMLRDLRLAERGVPTVLGDWDKSVETLRRHYKQILVAAEIGYKTVQDVPSGLLFHALRKTLGSMLCQKAGLHVACDRLGHSNVSVTRRYWDPRYGGAPRIAEILPNPLGTPSGPPPGDGLRIYRPEAG